MAQVTEEMCDAESVLNKIKKINFGIQKKKCVLSVGNICQEHIGGKCVNVYHHLGINTTGLSGMRGSIPGCGCGMGDHFGTGLPRPRPAPGRPPNVRITGAV